MTVAAFESRWALRAPGLLRPFNEAGVLHAADIQVARRLGWLGGDRDETVLLAVALAVQAVRTGSVCIELATAATTVVGDEESTAALAALPWPQPADWAQAVRASPLVAVGADGPAGHPLRWVDGLLYLDRYWRQEQLVRTQLDRRAAQPPPVVDREALQAGLDRIFPGAEPDRTRLAAACAAGSWVTVLAGGPGTGKTTTVARLLALLAAQPGPAPRIGLGAPTGKAAARLQEAVREVTTTLPAPDRDRLGTLSAATLHRLLGMTRRGRDPLADRSWRLPYDVVVVDETSMVSLTLMAQLLAALRADSRLVLVGDPDQLASVEAGAVLGDLVARPPVAAALPALPALPGPVRERDLPTEPADLAALRGGVVRLEKVHRYGAAGGIGRLAAAIRDGRAEEVLALLRSGEEQIEFVEVDLSGPDPDGIAALRADAVDAGRALVEAARAGRAADALDALGSHRLLCAHRRGPFGVTRWGQEVERWLREDLPGVAAGGDRYPGRPLLVTSNDYELKLWNGDTGVLVEDAGSLTAVFGTAAHPVRVNPSRLSGLQTVHAMTVHRAQGSQFGTVSVLLPPPESPLLSRELLYTAATRAQRRVRLLGDPDAVVTAVTSPIRRASGLRR